MSQAEPGSGPSDAVARTTDSAVAPPADPGDGEGVSVDWEQAAAWAGRHRVVLGGLILIVAQVLWKGQFLTHYYFRQDDFHVLELALDHPFSWNYLTFVGAGHLIPGVYAIAWVLARASLYSWGLASGVTLVLLAGAGLAALRLLRTLFGSRAAILIPLTIYLLTPMTLPDDSWWTSAIESVPLQIALFMALNSHLRYVRTGRFRHACFATLWITFGLFFFEKGLVLPLLLFAVTVGFLVGNGSVRAGARHSAVRFWRAWLLYLAPCVADAIILVVSLRASTAKPHSPDSVGRVLSFVVTLVKSTFIPGAIGGPWQWLPVPGGSYAFSSPPAQLAWLSWIVAVAIVVASVWNRKRAWRAWAILAGWLIVADILPVVVGRLNVFAPGILGLETRYVADAAPVLAICVGLAFWPVAGQRDKPRTGGWTAGQREATSRPQVWTAVAAGVVGAFVIGSIWSAQAYQDDATGNVARAYIANAREALRQAPAGTVIQNQKVPADIVEGAFGQYAYALKVIGDTDRGESSSKVRWISEPVGTVDHLMLFGLDGRLHLPKIYGRTSVPLAFGSKCWPVRRHRIVVKFSAPTTVGSRTLRIGYLASAQTFGEQVSVSYASKAQLLTILPGLHSAYLPVRGSAEQVIVSGLTNPGLCVGDVQAGILIPSNTGTAIPAVPASPAH